MTWVFVALSLAIAVALAVWWLERPLWYKSDGVRSLENFLRDLVSPRNPVPLMHVKARSGSELLFSRDRRDDGSFNLRLEASLQESNSALSNALADELRACRFTADQISFTSTPSGIQVQVGFGCADGSILAEATQAARIILGQLGVREDEPLRVRYSGSLDAQVVAPGLQDLERHGGPFARLLARAGLKHLGHD